MRDARPSIPAELESSRIVAVFRGEQPIAAGVVHWRGAWMEVPWASALREFNTTSSNIFLYWQMIQLAIASGCRQFEFGRCAPGEGWSQNERAILSIARRKRASPTAAPDRARYCHEQGWEEGSRRR